MKKKKASPQSAAQLLPQFSSRQVELRELRLMLMRAHQNLKSDDNDKVILPSVMTNRVNVKVARQDGGMVFGITFDVFGFYKEDHDSPEVPPLHVQGVYAVGYSIDSIVGLAEKDFAEFGQVMGVFNVWPYWRELVQTTMARMSLPSFTLPLFKAGSLKFAKDEEPGEESPQPKKEPSKVTHRKKTKRR